MVLMKEQKEIMEKVKKRINVLEKEIESETGELQRVLEQIKVLQNRVQSMNTVIISKRGGLLELKKISESIKKKNS